ncbi:hypothetical protein [Limnoraphis robusta]|uniref:hypothetical protein n=1 Tax=Limnoraphis robusta TaxID=1118279 RepID=UPI002B1F4A14|nr:hypothetical protein [Limnoraphis robusta]MEA5497146.1 hypothetical protein [Limnoraphis robusta BA-68 BA1]
MNVKEMIQKAIREELAGTREKWVRFSRLAVILRGNGIYIKAEYFHKNPDFLVYRTENINVFYVSLPERFPFSQNPKKHPPIKKRTSRSKKVISTSLHKLSVEDATSIDINSPDSFEQALRKILISLTGNQPDYFIQLEVLSHQFYEIYHQPIRQVMKKFYPNKKLKNILAESPLFLLRESPEKPNKWEVAVNDS